MRMGNWAIFRRTTCAILRSHLWLKLKTASRLPKRIRTRTYLYAFQCPRGTQWLSHSMRTSPEWLRARATRSTIRIRTRRTRSRRSWARRAHRPHTRCLPRRTRRSRVQSAFHYQVNYTLCGDCAVRRCQTAAVPRVQRATAGAQRKRSRSWRIRWALERHCGHQHTTAS